MEKIYKLPTDEEVAAWYDETILPDCSASSAIYLFRLWLKELSPSSVEGEKRKIEI